MDDNIFEDREDDLEEYYDIEEYKEDDNEPTMYDDLELLVDRDENKNEDKEMDKEESDIDDDNEDSTDIIDMPGKIIDGNRTIRYKFLTKYELARVLEAMCLMMGDPNFNIPPEIPKEKTDILEMAEHWIFETTLEIPVNILRRQYDKKSELVNIRKLKISKYLK